ncbi:MFS general substrate transporter [Thozetella sp. PMI_491]|nr:MFS general substrate transporter [Thozetella sp. PMI_491]
MEGHFRDTHAGHFIRLITRNRALRFPDEVDSSLWHRFVHQSASTKESEAVPEVKTSIKDDEEANAAIAQSTLPHIPPLTSPPLEGTSGEKEAVEPVPEQYLVGWYGPDDPENPKNWSAARGVLITAQICLLNFSVYIGSSIYTPGEQSWAEEFRTGEIVATLGLSVYVLGYGLGPMLFSPMSEMPQFGRSGIYFWNLLLFVLLQLPIGFASNIQMFLVFRFITGFLSGPALSTGGATIADVLPLSKVTYGMVAWMFLGVCGPVFGPIVGGFAAEAEGWRWTIWELTWLCSFTLLILAFFMPETNPANILYRRAKRLRKATGNLKLRSQSEIDALKHTVKDDLMVFARAFTLILTEPVVLVIDLYSGLVYGLVYIWFESFPLVFGEMYGFSISQQGLAFLGILIGGIIAVPLYLAWVRFWLQPLFTKGVPFAPEKILGPSFIGAVALPICLFWYGWTANGSIHWIVPIVGTGWFTVALVALFNDVLNYLGMIYPAYAASVFAGNSLMRATFGVVFPLFARNLFVELGVGPGNSLLGGLTVLFAPIPFVLRYYGHKIRLSSKKASHEIAGS